MARSGVERGAAQGAAFIDALQQDRERAIAALDVSRETIARLDLYVGLLLKWQKAINLVAPSTLPAIWTRHILDSAQIADLGAEHRLWADLGAGAGFPGMVIALMQQSRHPDCTVHLVESDRRKASFLMEAVRISGAPAIVHADRIETVAASLAGRVTAVTARALAPLPKLLELAEPLLTSGADGFFPKGQALDLEIEQALTLFRFDMRLVPSRTETSAKIAVIRAFRRREASLDR
ncbi:16S rRNA (guanine527-N7)-methyltransferase [Rhizobiales bacterium GAS191]|nr:16S rRNA (guanine527-N7)-methyltransferase [Rhizobiales bacterium GAS191]